MLSRYRNQVSVYPDGSQEQDLPPGSFCGSLVPRARVPVVQQLHAALSPPRFPHLKPGCCLSPQVNRTGSFFRHEPLFFLNPFSSQRGKGCTRCRGSSPAFADAVCFPPLWDRFLLEVDVLFIPLIVGSNFQSVHIVDLGSASSVCSSARSPLCF